MLRSCQLRDDGAAPIEEASAVYDERSQGLSLQLENTLQPSQNRDQDSLATEPRVLPRTQSHPREDRDKACREHIGKAKISNERYHR